MATPTRWRALDPQLAIRHWPDEDEWVVYSPRAASVHLLNESGYRLIQLASAQPRSVAEFARDLSAEIGVPADDGFERAVRQTIDHLDLAGLLDPVDA